MGTNEDPVSTRVLVVDDYPAVCVVATKLLTSVGYVVECAANGEHALQIIARRRVTFDVLLTDLHMPPGMRGDELARRAREYAPSLRLVVMTSQPEAVFSHPIAAGLDSVLLHKPFAPTDLLNAVHVALTRSTRAMSTGPRDDGPTTP